MFRQARNRGASGADPREAILSRIYEDNLRLRDPGYVAPKCTGATRRAPKFIAAASLVLIAGAGALPQQTHHMPMQPLSIRDHFAVTAAPIIDASAEDRTLAAAEAAADRRSLRATLGDEAPVGTSQPAATSTARLADPSASPASRSAEKPAGSSEPSATRSTGSHAYPSDPSAMQSAASRAHVSEPSATRSAGSRAHPSDPSTAHPAHRHAHSPDVGPAQPAATHSESFEPTSHRPVEVLAHGSGQTTAPAADLSLGRSPPGSKPAGGSPERTGDADARSLPRTLAVAPSTAVPADLSDPHLDLAPLIHEVGGVQPTVRELFGLSIRTIVIDAGHGGRDPGALGKTTGIQEKDLTLDIARRLEQKLARNSQYRILLVRDSDTFVSLKDRAAFANAHETDLFVSLHVNFMTGTSKNAVETYYFGRYSDARTRALAQRENEHSSYAVSEFEELLRGMQDRMKLHESKKLAKAIQASLLGNIRSKHDRVLDTGVKTAPFAVLLGVKAPSVLAEIGNLNSPQAEQSLGDPEYRDAIAAYLAAGITAYLTNQSQEADIHHVQVENRIAGN